MNKNKTRKEQQAVRLIDKILEIDKVDPHALAGSGIKYLKIAKKKFKESIRCRRTQREREAKRRGSRD